MTTHQYRGDKWEQIQEHLNEVADRLEEIRTLTEELREDYSMSPNADRRLEKLDDMDRDLETAVTAIAEVQERMERR